MIARDFNKGQHHKGGPFILKLAHQNKERGSSEAAMSSSQSNQSRSTGAGCGVIAFGLIAGRGAGTGELLKGAASFARARLECCFSAAITIGQQLLPQPVGESQFDLRPQVIIKPEQIFDRHGRDGFKRQTAVFFRQDHVIKGMKIHGPVGFSAGCANESVQLFQATLLHWVLHQSDTVLAMINNRRMKQAAIRPYPARNVNSQTMALVEVLPIWLTTPFSKR